MINETAPFLVKKNVPIQLKKHSELSSASVIMYVDDEMCYGIHILERK